MPGFTEFDLARVSYSVDNPFQPKQHVTDIVSTCSALVVERSGESWGEGGGGSTPLILTLPASVE
jgi:hypothetical protein